MERLRLFHEMTKFVIQTIEKWRRGMLINSRDFVLSLYFASYQYTVVVQSFAICKMVYIISIEHELRIHYYVFNDDSELVTSVSPLEKYAFSNVNFVIFVGKVQVDEPGCSVSSNFFPTIKSQIEIKCIADVYIGRQE